MGESGWGLYKLGITRFWTFKELSEFLSSFYSLRKACLAFLFYVSVNSFLFHEEKRGWIHNKGFAIKKITYLLTFNSFGRSC